MLLFVLSDGTAHPKVFHIRTLLSSVPWQRASPSMRCVPRWRVRLAGRRHRVRDQATKIWKWQKYSSFVFVYILDCFGIKCPLVCFILLCFLKNTLVSKWFKSFNYVLLSTSRQDWECSCQWFPLLFEYIALDVLGSGFSPRLGNLSRVVFRRKPYFVWLVVSVTFYFFPILQLGWYQVGSTLVFRWWTVAARWTCHGPTRFSLGRQIVYRGHSRG